MSARRLRCNPFAALGLAVLLAIAWTEAVPARSVVVTGPAGEGGLTLRSIVITGDTRFALVEHAGRTVKRQVGETVDAWTVEAIEPTRVTFTRPGASLALSMFGRPFEWRALSALTPPALRDAPVRDRHRRATDWQQAVTDLLKREGSTFNPADPSKWGVKLSTLQAHRRKHGRHSPGLAELKRLSEREARRIYLEDFIARYNLDAIPDPGLAEQVFDATVHHGPAVALAHLRADLSSQVGRRIAETGAIGPETVRAIEASIGQGRVQHLRHRLVNTRKRFLHRLGQRRPDIQAQLVALLARAESFRP